MLSYTHTAVSSVQMLGSDYLIVTLREYQAISPKVPTARKEPRRIKPGFTKEGPRIRNRSLCMRLKDMIERSAKRFVKPLLPKTSSTTAIAR